MYLGTRDTMSMRSEVVDRAVCTECFVLMNERGDGAGGMKGRWGRPGSGARWGTETAVESSIRRAKGPEWWPGTANGEKLSR